MKLAHLLLAQLRGNLQARAFFEIFRGVVVEFAVRNDFAGNRSHRIVVAQDGDFDFAGFDAALDQNLLRELRGGRSIAAASSRRCAPGSFPRKSPSVAGFTKNGKRNFLRISASTLARSVSHASRENARNGTTGSPASRNKRFCISLSMPTAEAEHARADVGKSGQIQQSLHGAVLAKRAVQHRENDVDPTAILRRTCHLRTVAKAANAAVGSGWQHHALARFQNFGQQTSCARRRRPASGRLWRCRWAPLHIFPDRARGSRTPPKPARLHVRRSGRQRESPTRRRFLLVMRRTCHSRNECRVLKEFSFRGPTAPSPRPAAPSYCACRSPD